MRASQDRGAASQSCSCTSCLYQSESERPSVKRILAEGSRIDKLYFGKYIPLRERKLLDKLVRTRAVYDDIRNQLLSESDNSIKEKANLKPRKHNIQARPKDLTATDKSSAILELVNLVDKGNVGGKKLSECCSCCVCGSKLGYTHEQTSQMRRHRHAHGHHGGAYTMSRTSMIRKKIGEVRRNVKFKAKSIKSAPCTCTSKLSSMIKRQSQEIIKRLRPEGSKPMLEQTVKEAYEQNKRSHRKKKIYQKIRKSKTRLMQSMGEGVRKVQESKTRLKEHMEAEGKKSLEKIRRVKHRLKENVKKSIHRKHPPPEELNLEDLFDFPIKKDSVTKFKERLQRKKLREYYACEPDVCVPDECVPEDCFKIIKLRRVRRAKKEKLGKYNVGVEKNIGVVSSGSNVGVQAKQEGKLVTTETEPRREIKRKSEVPTISVDVGVKKTGIEPHVTVIKSLKGKEKQNIKCACEEVNSYTHPKESKSVQSTTVLSPVNKQPSPQVKRGHQENSSVSFGIEIRKGKASTKNPPHITTQETEKMKMNKKTHKLHSELEKSSQANFMYTKTRQRDHALKRCFCTLKLKAKKNRPMKSTSKSTTATQSVTSIGKSDQLSKTLKHHEMECIECLAGECDPRECIKHKKRRPIATGVNVKPRHKSVSSLTSKSLSTGSIIKAKPKKEDKIGKRSSSSSRKLDQLKENSPERQVVRIGSSFSFSIEFYKDKSNKTKDEVLESTQDKIAEDNLKKVSRSTGRKKRVRHRVSHMSSSTGKSKYTLTKHSLRRCFCTLKLAHADKNKRKPSSRSQGIVTSPYTPDVTINMNKAIGTNKKIKLSPYECEPGVCVPDECDPYNCLKLINKRQNKYHTKQSNTDYRRTKSTSSFTTWSVPVKAKKVQSSIATYGQTNKKHRNKGKPLRQIRTTPSSPERQVVRISSNFSFNIDFYKDVNNKSSPDTVANIPEQRPSKISHIEKHPKRDRGYQGKVNQSQMSTYTHVKKKNRGSIIAPAMKKCFCTLKLQKQKDGKQKKVIAQSTIGTKTPDNAIDFKNVLITKSTKTKSEKYKFNTLEPYECEPYVCVPGECDPHECLKRIQLRHLKESGTLTERAKLKSATSSINKLKSKTKGASTKPQYRHTKQSITMVGDSEQKSKRQAVRLGSTFSFNIEFHKEMNSSPSNKIKVDSENNKELSLPKKIKHKKVAGNGISSSHQDTQVVAIKQANKAAGIRPMLKRCFCTLKLQAKNEHKLKTHPRTPKVITVSRVTTRETNFNEKTLKKVAPKKTSQTLSWAAAMSNTNSSITLSKSSVVFKYKEMQSYFHKKNLSSIKSNHLSEKMLRTSSRKYTSVFMKSALSKHYQVVDDNYACSENCLLQRAMDKLKYKERYITGNRSKNTLKLPSYGGASQDSKIMGFTRVPHYYTMNVQVPESHRNPARKTIHKLKPYECEPGICVPDACDPYECEKLIRKRLMKRVDKMSGTNFRSKSISSNVSQSTTNSKSKRLQSRKTPRETVRKIPASGINYESIPNRNHKQAVRVGSSFSFNIEFSKGQSSPAKYTPRDPPKPSMSHKPTKTPSKNVSVKGTKGYGIPRRDQDSQSITLTENKGSGVKPMMQRCFCTLKLQKKGKNQKIKPKKLVPEAFNVGTKTPPNTLKDYIASRTMMNTGQNTVNQKPQKLLPYECEPQVCIPGECDPYECLERIKKRNKKLKDSGTGAMRYKTSSSSNTGPGTRKQTKHIQSKPRKHKISRESTATRSSNVVTHHEILPSRQAVRVGSSFSFNVEFFKENAQSSPTPIKVTRESRPSEERAPKQKVAKKKVKVVSMQNDQDHKHKDSQAGNVLNSAKSTMTTSFIKRCFCTAKLHNKEQSRAKENKPVIKQKPSIESKASQANERKSFLKRCFCVLKLKKAELNNEHKNVPVNTKDLTTPTTVDKNVETNTHKKRRYSLEPYECEPGVCVPGECNPYECLKLIKARNVKLDTKEAFTDKTRTKSTSSTFKSSKTSKGRKVQSNFMLPSTVSKQQSTKVLKESESRGEPLSSPGNRQVVRIGSNFSFNIEFYKDRSPNTEEVQAAAKAIKQKPATQPTQKIKSSKTQKEHATKHAGSDGNSILTYDREAQASKAKVEDRASGFGPALKRCFCTLKLQKQNVSGVKFSTQKTGTVALKEIPTHQNRGIMTSDRKWKLKPYECEPNVCIPYECDPYECEKLIKKRNLKDTTKAVMTTNKEKSFGYKLEPYECEPGFCIPGECDPYECQKRIQLRNMKHRSSGTSPKRYRENSVSINTRPRSVSRASKVQSAKNQVRKRSKSVSSKPFHSKKSLDSTRQSVKIGSGFSFDIEFYKTKKSLNEPENVIKPIKRVKHTKSISSSVKNRSAKTKSIKMQYNKDMRDTVSQSLSQKVRDAGVNPFLKRCFCTLKLQKSGDMVSKHAIGRAARDKNVYMATLLPYECEPGICVPGECDPYECAKRIKQRQMRSQFSSTDISSQDTSTNLAAAKYKAAKNQANQDIKPEKRRKSTYTKKVYEQKQRPIDSSDSSSRRAVRIGSSFKFDVEFYRDNSPKYKERPTYSKPIKNMENVKTKPIKTHKTSRSITSVDKKPHHTKVQTKGSKTESRSTGVGPILKRCFCTLALHKQKSPPTTENKATHRNDDLSDLYQISKNVAVATDKKFKLKSYECEPNVCIPGQCDPYECYERIKRRLKDSGTETPKPKKKYASSITSKPPKYKAANIQAKKDKQLKGRPTMTSTTRPKMKKQRASRYSSLAAENVRQAVKVGSNFSFSLEFYKERPNSIKIPKKVYKIKDLEEKPKKHKTNKTTISQKDFASRASYAAKKGYDQKCQADCIINKTTGTTMGAFIKRCFCTLNLHKNPPRESNAPKIRKPQKRSKELAGQKTKPSDEKIPKKFKAKRPTSPDTKPAVAQTKEKYTANKTLPYKLKPYECEPNVCIPGECNPYECLERIKRRNIRRHSRNTGTHMRSSQVSVSSLASKLVPRTSRRVQSVTKRTRKVSHPQQVPQIVEQPRFAHMFDGPNRTGVKLGSNFSFNVEFYKDKSQVPTVEDHRPHDDYKEPKLKRLTKKSTFSESKPKGMHKGVNNESCDRRNCESQADSAIMKNKAAGVNNMLKRCFCTLKLQKNTINNPKVITVNRVAIQEDYRMNYKRTERLSKYPRNTLEPFSSTNKYQCDIRNKYISAHKLKTEKTHCCTQQNIKLSYIDCKEMKTLYPYIPTKFNKNLSKTILVRNTREVSFLDRRQQNNSTLKTRKLICEIPKERSYSRKSKGKIFLKKIFASFFLKRNLETKQDEPMLTKLNGNQHLVKPDILKSSKSDRRSTNTKQMSRPKQTNSLKFTKIQESREMTRNEMNGYQKHKAFSRFQYGDNRLINPILDNNLKNLCSLENYSARLLKFKEIQNNKNILNIPSPYTDNKIVQMAIIRPTKCSKSKVNTTTNTKPRKTRTKAVEASDNPNINESLLEKCKCLINKVLSKKDIKVEHENKSLNADVDNNKSAFVKRMCRLNEVMSKKHASIEHVDETSTTNGKKKQNHKKIKLKDASSILFSKSGCPCPQHRNKLLSSGDNQIGHREKNTIKAQNGKQKENKKKVELDQISEKCKKHKNKSSLPAGDAPEVTSGNNKELKFKKDKSGKKKTVETSTKTITKCGHSTPCPCCKGNKVAIAESSHGKTKKGKAEKRTGDVSKDKHGHILGGKKHRKTMKQYGAKLTIRAKGEPNRQKKKGEKKNDIKPCICGSKVCAAELKKLMAKNKLAKESKLTKPCICGSDVCARELKKKEMKEKLKSTGLLCLCKDEVEDKMALKLKAETDKKRMKEQQILTKKFKKEDKKRKKERKKADKLAAKQAKTYKDTHDGILAAESCLDVLKLTATAGGDLARCTSRAVMNPRLTYSNLKGLAKDPKRGFAALGNAVSGSGYSSACRRIRTRCCAMKVMNQIKNKMEGNAITHFLLHAADADPKKRLAFKKKRVKRRREPIDFECSLFMASLRRRPCLAVYYTCPWFYPHCLSMLTLWKQFTDIMLFIIAVTVWSPCIVAMELCRACVCCFFCTG